MSDTYPKKLDIGEPPESKLEGQVVQYVVAALTKWLAPVLLALVVGAINYIGHYSPAIVSGADPNHIVALLLSFITVLAGGVVTYVFRKATKNVAVVQSVLKDKGMDVQVDKFFGPQTLNAVVKAINDSKVKVTADDVAKAQEVPAK